MDTELEIGFEVDEDMQGIAVIRCPQCNTESRHALNTLSDGYEIACSCGFVIKLEGDAFAAMQRDFDNFNRLLEDF